MTPKDRLILVADIIRAHAYDDDRDALVDACLAYDELRPAIELDEPGPPLLRDIEMQRQNHPELIARDMAVYGIPKPVTRLILKARGVNKWFRVRRLLIDLKQRWKRQITKLQAECRQARLSGQVWRASHLRGRLEALTDCRQQVRALCHSPRDVDWPTSTEWPANAKLPADFPERPGREWIKENDLRIEPATADMGGR